MNRGRVPRGPADNARHFLSPLGRTSLAPEVSMATRIPAANSGIPLPQIQAQLDALVNADGFTTMIIYGEDAGAMAAIPVCDLRAAAIPMRQVIWCPDPSVLSAQQIPAYFAPGA